MLTGLYPLQHGAIVNDIAIRTDVTSVAHVLNDSGYRCAYIGKWHLGGIPRYKFTPPGPERLGFDAYWAVWNCHHDYMEPRYYLDDPEVIETEGYEPTVQTNLALAFLERHGTDHPDEPFCLFLSWGPPHSPYEPLPPGYEDAYDPDSIELPPNCHDTQQNRRDLAGYYAHISALDAELGRILGYLREEGLSDDTLVVYTSDHGSMLGSQGHTHKQRPWAESAMVPMIMAQPDSIPEGQENGTLFSLLDLASTLLGALGMPIPEAMQGADLSRCATEGVTVDNRILYLADLITTDQADHYGVKPWRGVKSERYTYACDVRGEWLLYDDEADPYQLNNLISDPAYAEVRADLSAAMKKDMAEFGDTLLDVPEALDAWGLTEVYRIRTEHLYTGTNMGGRLPR
jgi:arylsulfatase A-like enzyme